jgi:hypothetical protein
MRSALDERCLRRDLDSDSIGMLRDDDPASANSMVAMTTAKLYDIELMCARAHAFTVAEFCTAS